MKGYPAVLTALLLGFLPGLQLHALETDTFQVTDLTGHLPPQRQQALTRQAQDQLERILRFYGEPPGTGQMGKIHLEFDQPRKGVYATNSAGYTNLEVDKLLKAARLENDTAKRQALYSKAYSMVADDAPMAWLVELAFPTITSKSVKNVTTSAIGVAENFATTWVEKKK